MKKFIITEEEKNRILGMHKSETSRPYLNEQVTGNTVDELWRHVVRKVGDSKWTRINDSTPQQAGSAWIDDKSGNTRIGVGKVGPDKFGFSVYLESDYLESEENKKLYGVVKGLVDTLDQSKNKMYHPDDNEFRYYPLDASDADKVVEVINKLIPILKL